MLRFVSELSTEFWAFNSLYPQICQALSYCCVPEITPLMEVPVVKVSRAKQLFAIGFRSVKDIANATEDTLVKKISNINRKQAREVIRSARHLLKCQADILQQEVENLTKIANNESFVDAN